MVLYAHIALVPGSGRWRQEDQEAEAGLCYMRPSLTQTNKQKQEKEGEMYFFSSLEIEVQYVSKICQGGLNWDIIKRQEALHIVCQLEFDTHTF